MVYLFLFIGLFHFHGIGQSGLKVDESSVTKIFNDAGVQVNNIKISKSNSNKDTNVEILLNGDIAIAVNVKKNYNYTTFPKLFNQKMDRLVTVGEKKNKLKPQAGFRKFISIPGTQNRRCIHKEGSYVKLYGIEDGKELVSISCQNSNEKIESGILKLISMFLRA